MTAFARPTLLAVGIALLVGIVPDADAQRRGSAPRTPPGPTACTDFYSFHNKDWLAATPAPARGTVSALGELRQLAQRQQIELLQAAQQPQNDVQRVLGDFWASGMNEAAVEAEGAQPIAQLLGQIDGIRRVRQIPAVIAGLHQIGIPVLFNFSADLDLADPTRHIGYFTQGGLGLPDPAYYTRPDAESQALLVRYRDEYIIPILRLTGVSEEDAADAAAQVLDLEMRIAQKSRDVLTARDPKNNYALAPVRDTDRRYRRLQLTGFLKTQGVEDENISLANPELFAELDALVGALPVPQWQHYLRFHLGATVAPYLSQPWRDADYAFRGQILRGEAQPDSREVQVLEAIDRAAGPLLAREYVARHLSSGTRARAEIIADQVRDALLDGIERSSWLSAQAKTEAKAKVEALRIDIGAPNEDLTAALPAMDRASFGTNMLQASAWRHREEMQRIGRTDVPRRWDVLPQHPALAYDIVQNRLLVTAAVLQPPVLDMTREGPAHYGAYGALVGHELGRSVDVRGRAVDAQGEIRDWWSQADRNGWDGITSVLARQYSAFPYPGLTAVSVDGERTRDENAADLAGVELAWQAFSTAVPDPEETQAQQFFAAWAELWRQQSAAFAATRAAQEAPNAPGQWRVNGPLTNLPAFGAAFSCKADTPMQRAEDDQVTIWR
ncbi:M13-type metalloendopeptidase [Luteimonas abyssi]|uniref:M13-type metalloendopeptidase n=1 Tax=Luteimonas abyssi TaxID=1247514 RepID=UPI000737BA11|nr:M13 family metallopeptidase [Luteimonas abyssi]